MKSVSSSGDGKRTKLPARHQMAAICSVVESLESRLLLSADLTPLATFNGTNGEAPLAVVADSSGNIFGVTAYTQNGQQSGSGVLFEVPAGTTSIQDLASFGSSSNIVEGGSVIVDSSGNVYGTTNAGAAGGDIFEVPQGSNSLTTVATFASTTGSGTQTGPLTCVDSTGDLFGVSYDGSVYEVVAGSGTITPQAFGTSNLGLQTLELGPDGNLYGTTGSSIVEISLPAGTISTLGTFDSATTGNTPLGITFDASGDLWGFCQYGGAQGADPGNGTVWELPVGSTTITAVSDFTTATGFTPLSRPVIDSSGNIFGLAENGGVNGDGTLFEVATNTTSTDALSHSAFGTVSPAERTIGEIQPDADLSSGTAPMSGDGVVSGSPSFQIPNSFSMFGYTIVIYKQTAQTGTGSENGGLYDDREVNPTRVPPPPDGLPTQEGAQQMMENSLRDQYMNAATMSQGVNVQNSNRLGGSSGLPGQLAQIKGELSQADKGLKTATTEIKTLTHAYAGYTKEANALTTLNAELSTQTRPSVVARIQKQISSATAVENKYITLDIADYTTASTQLGSISTLQTTIQTNLDALPSPVVTLTGAFVSVPAAVMPGKKTTAVITVTNDGNVSGSGPLQVALSARPAGTSGSADITLPTATGHIHLASGASANEKLSFVVPPNLPAGTYSLVGQLDPANAFKETSLPSLIVSVQIFTAT